RRTACSSASLQSILRPRKKSLTDEYSTSGGLFFMGPADAKALGLISGSSTGIDVLGLYDLVGVAFHEISEVLGRFAGLNMFGHGYSVMDLFRYSAPGAFSQVGR